MRVGILLGGPYSKVICILGSISGSPYLGRLPYHCGALRPVGLAW